MRIDLGKYINCDLIFPDLECRDKDALIDGLVEKTLKVVPKLASEDLSRLIHEREKQTSTAIGEGLAFPHCRINSIDEILIVVAICREGINYDAPDKKPVKFIFMVIGPESKSNEYLSVLAHIAKSMFNSGLRKRLLACRSSAKILECLSSPLCKK